MPASHVLSRPSVLLWLGLLALGTAAQAETIVQQQGHSRTVVKQTDGKAKTHSSVVRTPTGQKVTTRTGNSTDVTIQESGPASALPIGGADALRRSRTNDMPASQNNCPPARSAAGHDCVPDDFDTVDDMELTAKRRVRPAPSIADLEERANSRIRSVSPD